MDPAALFGSANVHYVNEEYDEALKHYTCAVTLQDCAEYRSCRAATYLKLGKFEDALEDVVEALNLDEKSYMALHWKGVALFYLGDFAAAKLSFEQSLKISPNSKAPRILWVRKCDAELSGSSLPLGGMVATKVIETSAPAAASSAPAAASASTSAVASTSATDVTISGRKPVKREWYQNNTHTYITLFVKGVQEETCKADFQEKDVSLSFALPGSTDEDYQLDLGLFDAIDSANCRIEVSKVKVEVILAKKNVGRHWDSLERKDEVVEIKPDMPAYPTSSKQKRDWNQIDHEIEAQEKEEKPEGDQALNKLFQQIYERADPETRRAMNKSFQTSGGTVLSTNWGEVASADYEGKDRPTAPEGQQWKDWNQK
eukprot:TRINITY_DN95303_c0_g1_i1.p1 TRINITY_DN95303_c0_g1~~TRINITY_DN95303_c0_g1_i1.p1  ORF type:complete len:394 (+),score=100.70 TRINITY_DN95303_c0_g1_i1:67-1182(+)